MRKLLFALAVIMTGAFAFAAGSPASAASAGAVTGLADVVKSNDATQNIRYPGYCYDYPWRCRRRHYYRRHYYRPYYRPRHYYYRPYWRRHHHHRRHYYRW